MTNALTDRFKKALRFFLLIGVTLALVQYYPVIKAEAEYLIGRIMGQSEQQVALTTPKTTEKRGEVAKIITPVDKEFGIVIPKIGVNVPIIPQVDPFDSKEYQKALSKGIAHVKDTALPDSEGNTVLFAHSSDNFYNANRYNAVFYLLSKLEMGDEIVVTYENKLYRYMVTEKSVVEPNNMKYMEHSSESKLTLITCWPPGTTLKRLVVVAEP